MKDKIREEYLKSLENMSKQQLNSEMNNIIVSKMIANPKGYVKASAKDKRIIKIKELLLKFG